MLLTNRVLDGIRAGRIDRAFRVWKRPTVKSGGTLTTAIGVLAIDEVTPIEWSDIDEFDAGRAGFESRDALVEKTDCGREGRLYRIRFRLTGADPRIALRNDDALSDSDVAELRQRLSRFDAAASHGAWTERVLRAIAEFPELSAGELAARLGLEKERLKTDVRKLKALGLTESLQPGYRLSRRGQAFLDVLDRCESNESG